MRLWLEAGDRRKRQADADVAPGSGPVGGLAAAVVVAVVLIDRLAAVADRQRAVAVDWLTPAVVVGDVADFLHDATAAGVGDDDPGSGGLAVRAGFGDGKGAERHGGDGEQADQ